MRLPLIEGEIERRLLVNYRVDPEAMARQLPAPFRPQLVGGGGRLYPGVHHPASFQVLETRDQIRVAFRARDGSAEVEVEIRIVEELGGSAISREAEDASASSRRAPPASQRGATPRGSTAWSCALMRRAPVTWGPLPEFRAAR